MIVYILLCYLTSLHSASSFTPVPTNTLVTSFRRPAATTIPASSWNDNAKNTIHNLNPKRCKSVKNVILQATTPNDDDNNNNNNNNKDKDKEGGSILDRFTSPVIDDKGLPLADSLLSQIVAPTMQITWLTIAHAPIPSWLYSASSTSNGMLFTTTATSSTSGLLIVPTLIHGAGLTLCWVLGCLAAKNYESDAFNISGGRGYTTVILRLVQSGSFAVGILILSTQIDLLLEFGRYVQPGESDVIDVRLLNAIVEVINDVVFEAGVLSAWRLYRASLTGSADGRPPNYKP
jgi:hypothetical protein